jgi:hypothetical protein
MKRVKGACDKSFFSCARQCDVCLFSHRLQRLVLFLSIHRRRRCPQRTERASPFLRALIAVGARAQSVGQCRRRRHCWKNRCHFSYFLQLISVMLIILTIRLLVISTAVMGTALCVIVLLHFNARLAQLVSEYPAADKSTVQRGISSCER